MKRSISRIWVDVPLVKVRLSTTVLDIGTEVWWNSGCQILSQTVKYSILSSSLLLAASLQNKVSILSKKFRFLHQGGKGVTRWVAQERNFLSNIKSGSRGTKGCGRHARWHVTANSAWQYLVNWESVNLWMRIPKCVLNMRKVGDGYFPWFMRG